MLICGCDFPEDLHYLADHQVWLRRHDDGTGTVGITSLGIVQAGEIYMCRPKAPGSEVQQGKGIAVVELAKSIVSVKSPASGTVLAANPHLADRPELVHADPYGEGWIARLRLTAWDAEAAGLVHGPRVAPVMQHYAHLNRMQGP
jgi:glycine cleavage system H protein